MLLPKQEELYPLMSVLCLNHYPLLPALERADKMKMSNQEAKNLLASNRDIIVSNYQTVLKGVCVF